MSSLKRYVIKLDDSTYSVVDGDNLRYRGNGVYVEKNDEVVFHAPAYKSLRVDPVPEEPPVVETDYRVVQKLTCGLKFQLGGLWVGAHYSKHNRRWCINVFPCVTVWVALKGGKRP